MSKEIPYKEQKIRIYEVGDKFKVGILHYAKTKDNQRLKFVLYPKLYSTQNKAINKAKDLIDHKLTSEKWAKKPRT